MKERDDKIPNNGSSNNLHIMEQEKNQSNVPKYSEDWRLVEFHLKSNLSSGIEIKRILTIFNQHMIVNFERRAKNKLYTYAWFSFNGNLDEKNSLE